MEREKKVRPAHVLWLFTQTYSPSFHLRQQKLDLLFGRLEQQYFSVNINGCQDTKSNHYVSQQNFDSDIRIVALAASVVTEGSAHVVQSNQGKIEELQAQIDYLNGLVNVAEASGLQLRSAAPKRGRSLVEEEEHEQSQFQSI